MPVAADPAELALFPSLEEVRELAREHTLVPLRHTFVADTETPVSAYLKLRGGAPSFLLESAEQGQRFGRWSFLGFRPRAVIRWRRGDAGDPYSLVEAELDRYRIAPLEGLPPFAGGAVGLFGYDLVRSAEPTVGEGNPDEVGMLDLALMVSDLMPAFDHLRHEVMLANVFVEDDLERLRDCRRRDSRRARAPRRAGAAGAAGRRDPPEFESNIGSDGYAAAVERAKEYIRAGDVYQVVPSQRWSADAGGRVLGLPRPPHGQPEPQACTSSTSRISRWRAPHRSRSSVLGTVAVPSSGRSPAHGRVPIRPRRTSSAPRASWPTRRSAPST